MNETHNEHNRCANNGMGISLRFAQIAKNSPERKPSTKNLLLHVNMERITQGIVLVRFLFHLLSFRTRCNNK